MEKEVKLTAEEAQVLVNLLNVANKAAGLEVAEACLHFTKKLKEAFASKEVEDSPKKASHSTAIEDAIEVK